MLDFKIVLSVSDLLAGCGFDTTAEKSACRPEEKKKENFYIPELISLVFLT